MKRTKIGAPQRRLVTALGLALILLGVAAPGAIAQKNYAPGVTDTEIKLGQTMPYSGPASPYSAVGKAESAYFKMINEQGGVNGRKINLISLDDAFSPPKTVEQTRRLVEEDHVAFIWQSAGDAHQHGNPKISERPQDTAAVYLDVRQQVQRPAAFSLDDGRFGQLSR